MTDLTADEVLQATDTIYKACRRVHPNVSHHPCGECHSAIWTIQVAFDQQSPFLLRRMSITGNACIHCHAIIGLALKCPGCGWVDPVTTRLDPALAYEGGKLKPGWRVDPACDHDDAPCPFCPPIPARTS